MIYTHTLPDGRKYASLMEEPISDELITSAEVMSFMSSYGVSKVVMEDDLILPLCLVYLPPHTEAEDYLDYLPHVSGGKVIEPKGRSAGVHLDYDTTYALWHRSTEWPCGMSQETLAEAREHGVLEWETEYDSDWTFVRWSSLDGVIERHGFWF